MYQSPGESLVTVPGKNLGTDWHCLSRPRFSFGRRPVSHGEVDQMAEGSTLTQPLGQRFVVNELAPTTAVCFWKRSSTLNQRVNLLSSC